MWSEIGRHDPHRHQTYRYKRPPRKRKAVALEVPAIITPEARGVVRSPLDQHERCSG
jgi:hypothetical protein